ncbi:hypothetical protein HELRODRAFT_179203 [Helobdella robusta]|uniref:Uncharacterized protein n=1 Tax=Helobdella robusta TaxID=6412 RepID=T1FEC7_HELRO|nr:hypothetical protein HELRODRAFT_179194 [Helobdella robusta]XP_009026287.1 hypothetical protein HELRODRAFT_179203 [Helobdella robusta]ESN95718.1 hypothetical protein HELRODRAFT_179194 [Helobdella robusta]ESN95732.1 hypothetical protein HELRODRAFT_179203 [Helobdella robusta]
MASANEKSNGYIYDLPRYNIDRTNTGPGGNRLYFCFQAGGCENTKYYQFIGKVNSTNGSEKCFQKMTHEEARLYRENYSCPDPLPSIQSSHQYLNREGQFVSESMGLFVKNISHDRSNENFGNDGNIPNNQLNAEAAEFVPNFTHDLKYYHQMYYNQNL